MFCVPFINEINKQFLNKIVLRRQIINGEYKRVVDKPMVFLEFF